MPNINRLSGKVEKTPSTNADPDRYQYLDLKNAEPDAGVPNTNNALFSSDVAGERVWVNLSENFEVDGTGNLIVKRIESGTF